LLAVIVYVSIESGVEDIVVSPLRILREFFVGGQKGMEEVQVELVDF
jgi:hypothetical protein